MNRVKLQIGFIGVGAMGLSHLKAMQVGCARFAEAAAICSRNEVNIRQALIIAPGARLFSDEMGLIHSRLDAIFISTPNFTHVPLALESLRARKHVFLEKPCGVTRQQCRRLVQAADTSGRVMMIGHELRYSPYFQQFKALVDAGEIGVPRMVWTREFRGPFQKKSKDWIQDDRCSGGALVDKNCHQFDLMNWWVGARPRRVAAFGGCAVNLSGSPGRDPRVPGALPAGHSGPRETRPAGPGEHQVHDHATVSFEYANGVRGTLQLCLFAREFPGEDLEMGIVGDQGELRTRLVAPGRSPAYGAAAGTARLASPGGVEGGLKAAGRRSKKSSTAARIPAGNGALEILQWRRGGLKREPIIHKIKAARGEGWGSHLGFREIHEAFLQALLDGKRPLTTARDCVDGTLLAIAAEESIKRGKIIEIE
jgi:predicted dehydrogenase